MKLVAGTLKQPILGQIEEGSYTKMCVPDYSKNAAEATAMGLTVDGLVYSIGDNFKAPKGDDAAAVLTGMDIKGFAVKVYCDGKAAALVASATAVAGITLALY
jgi:hypothetical protein